MGYESFLQSKFIKERCSGFKVDVHSLNHSLFDWQKEVVKWALLKGRAALFESCGLGKTLQQLEWAQHVHEETGGDVLVVAPLAVAKQTCREGVKFGINVNPCRTQDDVTQGINITNYEMLDKFNTGAFIGVVLDESGILKSFMSKTKIKLLDSFRKTPYKLSATATPSPNDLMELLNQADFLGIMPSNEALSRWFINDTMHFGSYRLKGHAKTDFWRWVSTWAVCIDKPSDIGFDDSGYLLPELTTIEHLIEQQHDYKNGQLFKDFTDVNASTLYRNLKETAEDRTSFAAKLVNDSNESWICWCNTNKESELLKKKIPDAVEIKGAMPVAQKESGLLDFLEERARVLVSKPSMCGFGLNLQHCHNMAFVGLSYSFEQRYQAVRRCWRFGQEFPVNDHVIMTPVERHVYRIVQRKETDHGEIAKNMVSSISKHSDFKTKKLVLTSDYKKESYSGKNWEIVVGDSVKETKHIESDSIHFTIFSPPFSNLYIYSASVSDMGNSKNDTEFFEHFDFLIPELYRVTIPGRLCAVHCKDLVDYKGRDGRSGIRDFPGRIITHFEKHNWKYHSRVTIWKDPVIEMQRTKSQGLLHKQTKCDSSMSRQGLPDYLLVFRKWPATGETIGPEPVARANGFESYVGTNPPEIESIKDNDTYSIHVWQKYASPVWFDIQQTNVLNGRIAREARDEKHICLARGSNVLTKQDGYKPIQNVKQGDLVLTHRGRWRPVVAVKKTGTAQTITVKAHGVPGLTLTRSHKLWAKNVSKYVRKADAARKVAPSWIEAERAADTYINLKLPKTELPDVTSKTYWWTVGRWIADGHIDQRNTAVISVGKHKWAEFSKKIGRFGGNPPINGTAFQIGLRDPGHKLRDTLMLCGKGAINKQLPPIAYTLPVDQARSLLDGYLSGDGFFCQERSRWMVSSISRQLLLGLSVIIQRVYNSISSISAGRPKRTGTILGRTVNMNQEWALSFDLPSIGTRRKQVILADGAWKKVRSINDSGKRETWNLQVLDDESYTAEGCIVKNCPLQIDLIKRAVHLWTNEGDTVFTPFAGIGSELYGALDLKRKAVGIELKKTYAKKAASFLEAMESKKEQLPLFK